jgi:hypothetical protein
MRMPYAPKWEQQERERERYILLGILNKSIISTIIRHLNMWDSRYRHGLRTGRRGSIPGRVQTVSGAHPASYPRGSWGSCPGVKRPARETDHLPTSNAEVKNGGAVPPFPIYIHGIVLN